MIKRTFTFKTKDNLLQLYKCLVRPHLEYCMQVWSPYLKKDIDLLEGVQRRATNMILGYKHYIIQRQVSSMPVIKIGGYRRLRGDLIQAFKLLKGLDQITSNNFALDVNTSRRSHTWKVAKPRVRLDIRLHNFSHRVVNCQNNLPVEIVEWQSINNFKYKLSMFLSTRNEFKY